MTQVNKTIFREKLEFILNCHNLDNKTNTPDFILAEYLINCLKAFDKAVTHRDKFRSE